MRHTNWQTYPGLFLFTHLLFSFDHFRIGRDATRASALKKAESIALAHSFRPPPATLGYQLSAIRYGFGGDSRRIHNDPSIRNPQMSLCDRRNIETVSSHHQGSHLVLRNRPKNLE
jgi:hypothetical protein